MNTHHLHSSSEDEEDRLKELTFPEEAVLQQVGRARVQDGVRATLPHSQHLPA